MNNCHQDLQHIVFAESEHGLERSISLMLKMENYRVTVVEDCLEAYEKFLEFEAQGNPPNLLIIDFGRNTANSERFVKNLAGSDISVPVLIIAEYGDECLVGDRLLAKSSMYLSKPFEPQELMTAIEKSLKHY